MKNKPTTTDDYERRITRAVEWIRQHLAEKIDLKTLAGISAFSPYHFHRILTARLGEPVGEFIVRTRLEAAARMLRYTELSVSEIAYRVGYDAPSSLSKAFRKSFGVSPRTFKTHKTLPSMIEKKVEPEEALGRLSKPKILEVPEKNAAYVRAQGSYGSVDYGACFLRLWEWVKSRKLFSAGIEHIVVYHNDPDISAAEHLRCDVCLVLPKGPVPEAGIGVKTIGGGRYAVFRYTGPYTGLGRAYRRIWGEWLPRSGCTLRDAPCFEKYLNRPGRVPPEKLKTEIFLPVE
ncbi:AraC family transcriptional regulator [Alistipes sp. CHKCI003]|uniref:AraC family transcriptional regulator n=1 Tax=Alistipes sp. CHKCI003 TaxID=1780376 RepID=UPI0007A8E9A5|nr:AraC family transcriptional regulator [Alistipes sp. CHKCI003]CVI69896.1 HTH-type transcriptional activator RhaS [Alistipes sp. CHKCI003]HJC76910.1 AraC family transcriptional regulator [Candidatus Alistipes excrementavium]